ncbi:MAG: hypothetical protein DIZ80_15040 [endosymbiont of Galathealinum brachiosum]|uniref:Glycerophosphoryl diester phosphodiesterase membrane domain-containing protein n=1 Tax=endosymbiont of Galathealinum brachiosum TaxID=2200906 RepID=A0A370D9Z8_9GAMM|nr:MAG: hypothetical protein DIZ80_15040 [endosymbiont of Galathealinum brachiosum]
MSNVYQTPESNLVNENVSTGDYGSVEKALRGEYQFTIGSILSEAWAKTGGSKWIFMLGFILYFLTFVGIIIALGIVIAGLTAVTQEPAIVGFFQFVIQLGINLIVMPMVMGIFMMGVRRSVDAPISSGMIFNYFSKMLPLFVAVILINVLVIFGFILLVIPGIYLMISYGFAMPLIVEKGMRPWQAMETSRKAITHRWFSVFFLFIVMFVIVMIAMFTVIGLIWVLPMLMIAYGILYRNVFGVEATTIIE